MIEITKSDFRKIADEASRRTDDAEEDRSSQGMFRWSQAWDDAEAYAITPDVIDIMRDLGLVDEDHDDGTFK